MNLTIVLLAVLLVYHLFTKNGPFNLLELSFIPSSNYETIKEERSFNLVDLVSRMEGKSPAMINHTPGSNVSYLPFDLEVGKPDLMFFDYFTNHAYLSYVQETSEGNSKLLLKVIAIYQEAAFADKKLEIHDCLELNFTGQVTSIDYQSGKLLIQTKQTDMDNRTISEELHLVQSITCTMRTNAHHSMRYMFRDDSMLLRANFTELLPNGNKLEKLVTIRENLIGLDRDGLLTVINLVTQNVVRVEHEIDVCQRIAKLAAFGNYLLLVCYRPEGLHINTTLVVGKLQSLFSGQQRWQEGKFGLKEILRHKLQSSAMWRSIHDFLTFLDIVQIATSPNQNGAVVALKNEAIWLLETNMEEKEIKVVVKSLPVDFTDVALLGPDLHAYLVSSYGGRDTMITCQKIENQMNKKFSEYVARMPRRFYKHVAIGNRLGTQEPYVLILDHTGLTLFQQLTTQPHHHSVWLLLDMIVKIGMTIWQIFMYCLVCNVFIGVLCRARAAFVGRNDVQPDSKLEQEKTEKQYFADLETRLDTLCSKANFEMLRDPEPLPEPIVAPEATEQESPDPVPEDAPVQAEPVEETIEVPEPVNEAVEIN